MRIKKLCIIAALVLLFIAWGIIGGIDHGAEGASIWKALICLGGACGFGSVGGLV